MQKSSELEIYSSVLQSYLQGKPVWMPAGYWSDFGICLFDDNKKCQLLKQMFLYASQKVEDGIYVFQTCKRLINKHHQKCDYFTKRIENLGTWKKTLLGTPTQYRPLLSTKWLSFQFDIDAKTSTIKDQARFIQRSCEKNPGCSGLFGCSFFTNESSRLQHAQSQSGNTNHSLDACYVAELVDESSIICGVSDGLGGHLGDVKQDKNISKIAYQSAKFAVQLLARYPDVVSCRKDIQAFVKRVANHMLSAYDFHESATLLCFRTFMVDGHCHVVGVNIGDGILMSWQPREKKFRTLAKARHLTQKMGQGPAHLPQNYDPQNDVDVIDIQLPPDTILLPASDGLTEIFNTQISAQAKRNKQYLLTELDPHDMTLVFSQLPQSEDMSTFLSGFLDVIKNNVEQQRLHLLAQADQAAQSQQMFEADAIVFTQLQAEKKQIDEDYDSYARLCQSSDLSTGTLQEIKTDLEQRKAKWKAQQDQFRDQVEALAAQQSIRYGDDITVLALQPSTKSIVKK